jgi:hypothetical protein
MDELGIKSMELDEQDYAALEEPEQLAVLRDQGVISDEEFSAEKGQLMGL